MPQQHSVDMPSFLEDDSDDDRMAVNSKPVGLGVGVGAGSLLTGGSNNANGVRNGGVEEGRRSSVGKLEQRETAKDRSTLRDLRAVRNGTTSEEEKLSNGHLEGKDERARLSNGDDAARGAGTCSGGGGAEVRTEEEKEDRRQVDGVGDDNGDGGFADGRSPQDKHPDSPPPVEPSTVNGRTSQTPYSTPLSSPSLAQTAAPKASDDPQTDNSTNPVVPTSAAAVEGSLPIPYPSHRLSSPPVFYHPSQSAHQLSISSPSTAAPSPHIARLQQRHTLEVPKVSTTTTTSRTATSKDPISFAHASSAEDATPAHFSPTTPTWRKGSISLARKATRSMGSDAAAPPHLDDIPQDEDAARWADHIRLKRASKRKRKEDEDDDRVVVGTKVDQNHVNYVTAYNMLTGIRFTVSRTNAKLDRELTEGDFEAKHKFSFDM